MKNKETERKFIIDSKLLPEKYSKRLSIQQGYLVKTNNTILRIRTINNITDGILNSFITIKGNKKNGSCDEFEFEVPFKYGSEILGTCEKILSKTRYIYYIDDKKWEIDYFGNDMFIAEIELENISENINIPKFCIKEITNDNSYSNSELINNISLKEK